MTYLVFLEVAVMLFSGCALLSVWGALKTAESLSVWKHELRGRSWVLNDADELLEHTFLVNHFDAIRFVMNALALISLVLAVSAGVFLGLSLPR